MRVFEQPLERPVVERRAELQLGGPVHDDVEVRHLEGPLAASVAWRTACLGSASISTGGAGTWTQPKPAASIPFSAAALRPPFIWDVEAEAGLFLNRVGCVWGRIPYTAHPTLHMSIPPKMGEVNGADRQLKRWLTAPAAIGRFRLSAVQSPPMRVGGPFSRLAGRRCAVAGCSPRPRWQRRAARACTARRTTR